MEHILTSQGPASGLKLLDLRINLEGQVTAVTTELLQVAQRLDVPQDVFLMALGAAAGHAAASVDVRSGQRTLDDRLGRMHRCAEDTYARVRTYYRPKG